MHGDQHPHDSPREGVRLFPLFHHRFCVVIAAACRYVVPLQAFLSNYETTAPAQLLAAYVDASRRVYETFAFIDSNAAVM
jgi:hypothetical protein